jgi:ribosomal protein L11 methyltransferase
VTWTEVSLGVRPSQVEAAIAVILRRVPQGLWETQAHGRRVLRVYLPGGPPGRRALAALRRDLRAAAVPATVAARTIRDTPWQDAWRAHARPIRTGRLVVLPTWWTAPPVPASAVIRLDPGMAFGSGEHPTTHLCLAAIERHLTPGMTVVDIGTGSGILAIAAARLGARHVLAFDCDPVAVSVARKNVAANHLAGRVRVVRADRLAGARVRADLVVANLTADTLPPFLRDVRLRLRPGGRFVASGFTSARAAEVARAVAAAGLRCLSVARRDGWCAIHAIRPAAGDRGG